MVEININNHFIYLFFFSFNILFNFKDYFPFTVITKYWLSLCLFSQQLPNTGYTYFEGLEHQCNKDRLLLLDYRAMKTTGACEYTHRIIITQKVVQAVFKNASMSE